MHQAGNYGLGIDGAVLISELFALEYVDVMTLPFQIFFLKEQAN